MLKPDAARVHYARGVALVAGPSSDMSMRFASHTAFGDDYRLTRPPMIRSAPICLRDGCDLTDPRASPLLAKSHAGLPSAVIITDRYDRLRDEGNAYARAISRAGVDVDYKCHSGAIYGFICKTGHLKPPEGDYLTPARPSPTNVLKTYISRARSPTRISGIVL